MIESRARQVALLVLAAIARKMEELNEGGHGRQINKATFSTKALVNSTGLLRIGDDFYKAFSFSLEEFGWYPIFIREEIIVLRIESLSAPKIGLKKVEDILQDMVVSVENGKLFDESIIMNDLVKNGVMSPVKRTTSVSGQ